MSIRCAKRPTSKKHCKNQYETRFGGPAHRSKFDQKLMEAGLEERSVPQSGFVSDPGRFGDASGACLGRLEGILGRYWPLLGRPGRSQIGLGATLGRPKAVTSASRRVPETALGAQTGPSSNFRRCLVDLGFIFVDCRTIFRRFALKPAAAKTQNRNLKEESRDPHCASWLLRCALVSNCPSVSRNGL